MRPKTGEETYVSNETSRFFLQEMGLGFLSYIGDVLRIVSLQYCWPNGKCRRVKIYFITYIVAFKAYFCMLCAIKCVIRNSLCVIRSNEVCTILQYHK